MPSWLAQIALGVLCGGQDPLEVQVLDPAGTIVSDVRVEAHMGLAHYALAPDFDRWIAVEKHEARTDATGKATFGDLPEGARVTLYARYGSAAGMVEWTGGPCDLVLQPTGTIRGKVSARKVQLRFYDLEVTGLRGLDRHELDLDSKGNYEIEGVAAGEVELRVRMGGWLAGRATAEVKAGKRSKAQTLKISDEFETGADPMVDVTRVRLVDEAGEPMKGTSFTWVGPTMFGRMNTDEEGVVLLAGGNVAIGPPPFVLRLAWIGADQEERYLGRLLDVKRGTANVQIVTRLQELRIAVEKSGEPQRAFELFAVTGDDPPRVWSGRAVNGARELFVPPGPLEIVVGTLDGELHRTSYDLAPSEESTAHIVQL